MINAGEPVDPYLKVYYEIMKVLNIKNKSEHDTYPSVLFQNLNYDNLKEIYKFLDSAENAKRILDLVEKILADTKQDALQHALNSLLMYIKLALVSKGEFNEAETKFLEDLYIDLSEPKEGEVSFE